MLDDDWFVGDEDARIVGVAWNRLGVGEVVEAQVQRAPGGDGDVVRVDRVAVRVEIVIST